MVEEGVKMIMVTLIVYIGAVENVCQMYFANNSLTRIIESRKEEEEEEVEEGKEGDLTIIKC